jgi:hypothetical protein
MLAVNQISDQVGMALQTCARISLINSTLWGWLSLSHGACLVSHTLPGATTEAFLLSFCVVSAVTLSPRLPMASTGHFDVTTQERPVPCHI